MTTTKSAPTDVVVVDGSNIATEGRSMPSLQQLNDAVMAFRAEYPDATVTVVVDATFGHRIAKSEVAEFDEAVAHNELVAPPAGAIGRGDAFVLSIANKVGARILTNDSYQEFHGQYPWLFDEGRLIGGKPVPHVGWVFVDRLPVKGPTSRKAQRAAKAPAREARPVRRQASKEASLPMPVPSAPPPGGRSSRPAGSRTSGDGPTAPTAPAAASNGPVVNELLPFLEFVEKHPVGSSVNGVVESYSSHGAYVTVGDIRGYVPLRLMADPAPRSAREVMRIDDAVTLVVVSFAPARRSIDLAVPAMAPGAEVQPPPELEAMAEAATARPRGSRRSRAGAEPAPPPEAAEVPAPAADQTAASGSRRGRRRAGAGDASTATTETVVAAAVEAAAAELAGEPAPTEDAAGAETSPATKRAGKKTAAAQKAPAQKAAKRAPATTPATKSAAKKAPAEQTPGTETPAARTPAARTPAARKSAAKKAPAKKSAAKKATTKKSAAKKATATEEPAKKAAARTAPATEPAAPSASDPARVEHEAVDSDGGSKGARKRGAKRSAPPTPTTQDTPTTQETPARARRKPVAEPAGPAARADSAAASGTAGDRPAPRSAAKRPGPAASAEGASARSRARGAQRVRGDAPDTVDGAEVADAPSRRTRRRTAT